MPPQKPSLFFLMACMPTRLERLFVSLVQMLTTLTLMLARRMFPSRFTCLIRWNPIFLFGILVQVFLMKIAWTCILPIFGPIEPRVMTLLDVWVLVVSHPSLITIALLLSHSIMVSIVPTQRIRMSVKNLCLPCFMKRIPANLTV